MAKNQLRIGWAQADLTPPNPVPIAGNFDARISESVRDPISVTAWTIETGEDHAVFVSCDLVTIPDELRDAVRSNLEGEASGPDPVKVVLNATHTHYGPEIRVPSSILGHTSSGGIGIDLAKISAEAMSVEQYVVYAAKQISEAIRQSWASRAPGGIAFGMDYAVIGRNRRWVDADGGSTMHGLNETTADRFRHIEGYEDHSVQLISTYDQNRKLTGLIINLPCPAQSPDSEASSYEISADFWHETRHELRLKFGDDIFILPQCSSAGDQTAYVQYDKAAEARMLRLKGRTKREEIARSITCAVESILAPIRQEIDSAPVLRHHTASVQLSANRLTEAEAVSAKQEAEVWRVKYEEEKEKLEKEPELRRQPRWYKSVSIARRRMQWLQNVANRYELQKQNPVIAAEIHVVRVGEIILASVPFEYYLDYGIQIKARSPATQTFLIQLAGGGTYVPSPRSLVGGGYGSIPSSNPVGSEGGQQLAEYLVQAIRSVW
jgi:hypothetical protein